jgi:hypothetical protein
VELVEEEMFRQFDKEVPSRFLADEAARRLRQVDLVSYIRFASVYRQFQDVGDFIEQAQTAIELAQKDSPGQQELFAQAVIPMAPANTPAGNASRGNNAAGNNASPASAKPAEQERATS